MKLELRKTEDGSHTLWREDLDESYHSHRGALGESLHVFIENGLNYCLEAKREPIRVFEVGFGTGLNAWLTRQFAHQHQISVDYEGVEPVKVAEEIWKELNYADDKASFNELHQLEWDRKHQVSDFFSFLKWSTTLETHESPETFDVIFMDAACLGQPHP